MTDDAGNITREDDELGDCETVVFDSVILWLRRQSVEDSDGRMATGVIVGEKAVVLAVKQKRAVRCMSERAEQ